jgi:hypothetical protein
MDRKEKIKLLADLNGALDSKELKAAIERAPSGGFIWELLSGALNANIDSLLSDEAGDSEFVTQLTASREETIKAVEQLRGQLDAIRESPVMTILAKMGATLQAANANSSPQAEAGTVATSQNQQHITMPRRNPEGRGGSIAGLI